MGNQESETRLDGQVEGVHQSGMQANIQKLKVGKRVRKSDWTLF